ncbi:protein of unknown function [Burkholderia multivorans]
MPDPHPFKDGRRAGVVTRTQPLPTPAVTSRLTPCAGIALTLAQWAELCCCHETSSSRHPM